MQNAVQGAATTIVANQGANTNHRWAYLRFDLSSIDVSTITTLTLSLHATQSNGASTTIDVYGLISNEAFNESTLTYNNDPNRDTSGTGNTFNIASAYNAAPLADFLSTASGSGSTEVAFNVSSGPVFDFANADSDKVVTFVLNQQFINTQTGQAWSSKEATTASLRPVLAVTTAVPEPATLSVPAIGALALLARRNRQA